MKNLIQVKNLTYHYEPKRPAVIKELNLNITAGEYIALIGPNGCGKTTLIRHFNALLLPSAGTVEINGLTTQDSKSLRKIRGQVGMIFQNPDNQIVGMSVEEDVAFGPGNLGLPPGEIRRRVDQSLAMVGLTGLKTRSPYSLSGGQKQLLALAGLLAMDPQLIVLDEPTAALVPNGKKKVLALLQELNEQGIGIIHVTQNMDEAALAERVLVMDKGELIADGRPIEILSKVEWLKELGLAPPQITQLMWQLQQAGVDVNCNILNADEAVDEIKSLLTRISSEENVDCSRRRVDGNV